MWFVIHLKNHGATEIWANYMENHSKIAKLNYCPILLTNVIFSQLQFPFHPMSLAAGTFRSLTGLWTFLRRLLPADSLLLHSNFKIIISRPYVVCLKLRLQINSTELTNLECTYHMNHQFNDLSMTGISILQIILMIYAAVDVGAGHNAIFFYCSTLWQG